MYQSLRNKISYLKSKIVSFFGLERNDKNSYLILAMFAPSILLKTLILIPPTTLFTIFSKYQYHGIAKWLEYALYSTSYTFNKLEWYCIIFLSLLASPIKGWQNLQKNQKIIQYFQDDIGGTNRAEWGQLSYNLYNASQKEGFTEVGAKLLAMFTLLPTYRHCFLNNPVLFEYQLYYTNQMSKRIENSEHLSKIVFSYIGHPEYLEKLEKDCGEWNMDDIGFTPSYFNHTEDQLIDYSNMGLQIAAYYATNINLDTVIKTPEQLQHTLENQLAARPETTIAHSEHSLHQHAKEQGLNMKYEVSLDTRDRVKVLDLVVPYYSFYHCVTGRVEANVADYQIIEHPMICLTHNGREMQRMWNAVNKLFNEFVMEYLSHYGVEHEPKITTSVLPKQTVEMPQ